MTEQKFWQKAIVASILTVLVSLANVASAQETNTVGTITFTVGDATLERNTTRIPLTKGVEIKVGDRLQTGADGHIHVRMIDQGFIGVRPSAKLHIQAYHYAPNEPTANRVGLYLEKGVARTISGKAGEAARENYRFNTPVAAIGLRGTDYVVQAMPEATRVSVLKGAVTLSAFGPTCDMSSLATCSGPNVRELAANIPHAYMEIRSSGGIPTIVLPENAKQTPNSVAPPRPEELGALESRLIASALTAETLRTTPPKEPLSPVTPVTPPTPETTPSIEPRAEIAWGRWSSVALQNTPTLVSLKADDREITFGNALFGLLRPTGTPQLPTTGVISMNYAQGEAYLQNASSPQTLLAAALSNGKLNLDFNNRQFSTSINATVAGNTYALNAQGQIQFQGYLLTDASLSNMNVAGALSNNANEAGYLFNSNVAANQTLIGATRWKR